MIGTNFDPLEENLPEGWVMREAFAAQTAYRQSQIQEEDELYHERFARLQAEREAIRERESRDRMQHDIDKERALRLQAEAEVRRLQALLSTAGINPRNIPAT